MKINQRCRVYGRFLTEARKGKKEFIQVQRVCRRFALSLCNYHRHDGPLTHHLLLMQISDGWKLFEEYTVYFTLLIGQCIEQLSAGRYHKIIMCTELMHVYMYVYM